jgi:ATP-binding protein involved in chromosome partitioning
MLIDLPGTGDIHLSIMQSFSYWRSCSKYTAAVALADAKRVSMFLSEAINVPVLGIIENMAYFTPELINIIFLDKKVLRT